MSLTSKVTFLQNSVALATAQGVQLENGPTFRKTGVLTETITLDDLDDEYTTWISVAVREGSATVTLPYTTGTETFIVAPGLPLHYQTKSDDTFSSDPSIVRTGTDRTDVEIAVYTGTTPVNASPPYLILNAGRGITQDDFDSTVTGWTDTRAASLAPLIFDQTDSASDIAFIASDPDFGGKPSVDFSTGDGYFTYSGAASVFSFMDGASDFTMMMIFKVSDDATAYTAEQGIWNTSSQLSVEGYRALIDGGYRHHNMVINGGAASQETLSTDELDEKPVVMVWRYDASAEELRVYWQGRWHDVETGDNTGGTASVLQVGLAKDAADASHFFRGKIADLTLYNSAVGISTIDAYIASAVANYGIDDTEHQGFPWIADAASMHRANRGVVLDELGVLTNAWYDTRSAEATVLPGSIGWGPSTSVPSYELANTILNEPAFVCNGTDQYLSNTHDAASAHLGGNDMTITMVFYSVDNSTGPGDTEALFSMGTGYDDSSTTAGTSIFYYNENTSLRYQVDDLTDAEVFDSTGANIKTNAPYAVVFRSDGTNGRIDEMNLSTGERVTQTVSALLGTPDVPVDAPAEVRLFASRDDTDYHEGGIAEVTTTATSVTNEQVTEFFAYALARYGS